MTALIFLTLTQQHQHIEIKNGYWKYCEPKQKVSRHWAEVRDESKRKSDQLAKRSEKARYAAFAQIVGDLEGTKYTDERLYYAAHLRGRFFRELYGTRASNQLYSLMNTAIGVDDPEFLRTMYLAITNTRDALDWKLLGPKLRKIFPHDEELKRAFVNEAIFGSLPTEYIYQGRTILYRDLKNELEEFRFIDLAAECENRLYWRNQRKIHLTEAIKYLKLFVPLQRKRNGSTKQAEAVLKVLEERLAKGKYVDK